MLLDAILKHCDNKYRERSRCSDCNHPSGECSTNCELCLKQVHFLWEQADGKKDYDCQNMLNFYACKYLYKYVSEIYYLLKKSSLISSIDKYHILSIGCGAAPDLVAFERYLSDEQPEKTVSYFGCDINKLWSDIHDKVCDYTNESDIIKKCRFKYADAIEWLNNKKLKKTNVIVLQYIISHLYNTNQITKVDSFFDAIIQNVISYKEEKNPLIILINDVNSCNKGRNYFSTLVDKLLTTEYNINVEKWYFDYHIQNANQQYGFLHSTKQIIYDIPQEMNVYNPWLECSSAQMLIEVR